MSTSEAAAGERLSKSALRDFAPSDGESADGLQGFRLAMTPEEAPVPVLLRHALTLIGCSHGGPGEKVAWWVSFSYKGHTCELAHEKFGLRIRIWGDLAEKQAAELLTEMRKKLLAAVGTVEALLTETAGATLNAGDVTVVNQHLQLRRAYSYFRERATSPDVIEDVRESGINESGMTWYSFTSGKNAMAVNAFHDLVAAISAFVSSLEHDLVLTLPFLDFDPRSDDLTKIIGDRWGEKWRRVVGHSDKQAVRLRERLLAVVERWRNPYSHGGFEKGHGATLYLHTPGLGALPVALSGVRESPMFSFHRVSETDIAGVFALFDEIDAYLVRLMPEAMEWIESGLNVRFDTDFMAMVVECIDSKGSLQPMIELFSYREDMIANMDY